MRLIDANTLKAEFTGNFQSEYSTAEIHALIDLAPTVGGWISVKDRLPDANQSVIVVVQGEDYTYRTVAWLNTCGDWDSNDDGFNQDDEEVVYWMPLQEPPEELKHEL